MKRKIFLPLLLLTMTLIFPFSTLAQQPQRGKGQEPKQLVPFTYITEQDGTIVPIYLIATEQKTTQKAINSGIITKQEAMYTYKLEKTLEQIGVLNSDSGNCPNVANQRDAGWDEDNDYYKNYEHPEGLEYGYCITVWYQLFKGSPNSYLFAPHYGSGLFRRRMIIGLSEFPAWFADQQAYLVFTNIS